MWTRYVSHGNLRRRQLRQTLIKLVDCSHYQLFHLAHNIITNPTLERRLTTK